MTVRRALTHPWLTIRVQLALGAIFIVAAIPKIADPPSFAHMIYNYRIVPGPLVNVMALLMPWIEILAGLALALGVWKRGARALIGVLLVVFIVAILVNLARGNAIDCGCFNVNEAGKSFEQRLSSMWWDILRDLGMLALLAQQWLAERHLSSERAITPSI